MRKQVVHTDRVPPARVPLTRQVCENLEAILEAAGSALDRVVNVTIYMKDVDELSEMNRVFSAYFLVDPPARTTFECARLIPRRGRGDRGGCHGVLSTSVLTPAAAAAARPP